MKRTVAALAVALACARLPSAPGGAGGGAAGAAAALDGIDALEMLRHIRTLSSSEFEGRAPGTRGEDLTVAYLVGELRRLGLRPGNPDGSYLQMVPMLGIRSEPSLQISAGDRLVEWVHGRDFVAGSTRPEPAAALRGSELVFVGYGVVAPEYGWDDYKGADVRGKTLVALMDDPQIPHPEHPTRYDPAMFRGAEKTYYATGRHKREVAARNGATALLFVHEEIHAGWPFRAMAATAGRESLRLREGSDPGLALEGFVTAEKARELLALAGRDLESLRRLAVRRDFRPQGLGAAVSFAVTNEVRELSSANVVARVEGGDPRLRDECVVYSAHWDHLGRDPRLRGDQVFHGAVDNASGVAALLEIARAYTRLPAPPPRSVLFLITTGEESGLLGARYYVSHPLVPLARTVVDLNLDVVSPWGRTRDLEVVGRGLTDLDGLLDEIAARHHKVLTPDVHPSLGLPYRQDGLEFALAGVPSLFVRGGEEYADDRERARARKMSAAYADDYHAVTDTVRREWNLAGAVDLARFDFAVGHALAQGGPLPQWLPGGEFGARGGAASGAPPARPRASPSPPRW